MDYIAEVNCVPRSEVMQSGMTSLDTHLATKVSANNVAEISLSGTASSHLVDLSIIDVVEPLIRDRKRVHEVHMNVCEAAAGNRNRLDRGGGL
jgi:hypothetical protein